MNFLLQFVISLVLAFVSAARAPKPKSASVQEGDVPRADASSPIPVVFGTVRVKAHNTVWYGDPKTKRVTQKAGK